MMILYFVKKIKDYFIFYIVENFASFVGSCNISAEIGQDYVGLLFLMIGLTIQSTPVHLSAICANKLIYVLGKNK